jgi:acetyl esterase/lipase
LPLWGFGAALAAGVFAVIVVAASSSGGSTGGIDNGQAGSRCESQPSRLTKPPEAGTRAGSFDGDYYEVGEPIPPRQHPPLMLIIHGGGSTGDGPGQVESVRNQADMWRQRGWRTLNLDYHACARSVADVVAF